MTKYFCGACGEEIISNRKYLELSSDAYEHCLVLCEKCFSSLSEWVKFFFKNTEKETIL